MPVRRQEIGERDGWVCGICQDPARPVDPGRQCPDPLAAVADHIIPRSRGGPDTPGNLQIAHFRCNALKWNGPAPFSAYARAVLSLAVDGTPIPARVWQRYGDSPRR